MKGAGTSYLSGRRGWLKYRIRDTVEAVVGAVIASLELLVAPWRDRLGIGAVHHAP